MWGEAQEIRPHVWEPAEQKNAGKGEMGRSHQKRLVRLQGARGRSVMKHAKLSGCGRWFHAAVSTGCGGERSCIWAAVNLSMTSIGPPHLGQSQSGLGCLVAEVPGSVCGTAPSN